MAGSHGLTEGSDGSSLDLPLGGVVVGNLPWAVLAFAGDGGEVPPSVPAVVELFLDSGVLPGMDAGDVAASFAVHPIEQVTDAGACGGVVVIAAGVCTHQDGGMAAGDGAVAPEVVSAAVPHVGLAPDSEVPVFDPPAFAGFVVLFGCVGVDGEAERGVMGSARVRRSNMSSWLLI